MKQFLSEAIWPAALVLVAAMMIGACLYGCHECNETDRVKAQSGLVEKPNVGSQGYHWEKP